MSILVHKIIRLECAIENLQNKILLLDSEVTEPACRHPIDFIGEISNTLTNTSIQMHSQLYSDNHSHQISQKVLESCIQDLNRLQQSLYTSQNFISEQSSLNKFKNAINKTAKTVVNTTNTVVKKIMSSKDFTQLQLQIKKDLELFIKQFPNGVKNMEALTHTWNGIWTNLVKLSQIKI